MLSVSDPGSPIPSVSSQCISVMSAFPTTIFTPSRSSTLNSASSPSITTQMMSPVTVPTVASTLSTSSLRPNTTIQSSSPPTIYTVSTAPSTLISTSIPSINTQMIFPATVSTTSTVSNIAFTSAPTASTYTQSLSSSTVSTPKCPTSQDTNSIPVAGTDTDETAQDALELDYECCECLGTYQEDISVGNGAEWIKCGGFMKNVLRIHVLLLI